MRTVACLLIVVFAAAVFADDGPRSAPAQRAMQRHDQAVRRAEQAYRQALAEAARVLIRELDEAKAQAMKGGQLEEANAIQAAIDAAKADLDGLTGRPQVRTFTIKAATPRTATIEVRSGEKITIRASGRWTHSPAAKEGYGPEGAGRTGSDLGTLQGQIGDGAPFLVGRGAAFTADADGMLYLFMRDSTATDNQGAVEAVITRQAR